MKNSTLTASYCRRAVLSVRHQKQERAFPDDPLCCCIRIITGNRVHNGGSTNYSVTDIREPLTYHGSGFPIPGKQTACK